MDLGQTARTQTHSDLPHQTKLVRKSNFVKESKKMRPDRKAFKSIQLFTQIGQQIVASKILSKVSFRADEKR